MKRVCVFCGSSEGSRPIYAEAAQRTGEEVARRGLGLIYGGGKVGLMEAVADAALAAGGEVIGVMPDALVSKEIGHEGLTELHVVGSMHERKKLMADLSDGFVALPGGYGTLEEFLEVLSWAQLSIHEKPCALLDVVGYWEPLTAQTSPRCPGRIAGPRMPESCTSSPSPASCSSAPRSAQALDALR